MNKEFSLDLLRVGNLVEFNTGELMRVVELNKKICLMNYKSELYNIEKSDDRTNYIIISNLGKSYGRQLRVVRVFLHNANEDFDKIYRVYNLNEERLILWEEKSIEDEEDYLAKWKRLNYNTKIKATKKVNKNVIVGEFWGVDERTVANKKEDGILLKIIDDGEVGIRNLHFNWYDFEVVN